MRSVRRAVRSNNSDLIEATDTLTAEDGESPCNVTRHPVKLGAFRGCLERDMHVTPFHAIPRARARNKQTGKPESRRLCTSADVDGFQCVCYAELLCNALLATVTRGKRMGRDSNPRCPFGAHTLSRRAQSTALSPIQRYLPLPLNLNLSLQRLGIESD